MGSGISPHPLLIMGPWVTHNLPTFGSLYLSQSHTTFPTHMGSEISFHPHSHMNGFWNLPHPMHIFLESPILKPHQKKISLNIMPRQTYIHTKLKVYFKQICIIDNIYFFVNSNSTSPMHYITTFFSGSHMLINVSYSRNKELYILLRNFQYNEFY